MISRIKGTLTQVSDSSALVENGGVFYRILVPSALADRLKDNNQIGQEVTFDTIYYIEAGDRKSNHYPRLVGFTDPIDREFFSLFTQVPGLGVKKALRSLVLPIKDIATAIENKNASTLGRLPGVGGRLAEKIIAELNGKTAKFALSKADQPLANTKTSTPAAPFENDALEVLLQLQYKPNEAKLMIESAVKANPKISSAEDLISFIFRNEQKGLSGS